MDSAEYCKRWGIGLTGGVATGKSTVAGILREAGVRVFDADLLARQAVEPNSATLKALVQLCGKEIVANDGSLERKKLGALIFANPPLRKQAEALIHHRIWQLLEAELEPLRVRTEHEYWFLDAALLFETDTAKRFAQVWLTTCPEAVQRRRIQHRDNLAPAYVDQVMASQLTNRDKESQADVVIDTNQPLAVLRQTVLRHLQSLSSSGDLRIW